MIYPSAYLDEDNFEEFNNELRSMEAVQVVSAERQRIYIGSGEDAQHAWEQSNGNA